MTRFTMFSTLANILTMNSCNHGGIRKSMSISTPNWALSNCIYATDVLGKCAFDNMNYTMPDNYYVSEYYIYWRAILRFLEDIEHDTSVALLLVDMENYIYASELVSRFQRLTKSLNIKVAIVKIKLDNIVSIIDMLGTKYKIAIFRRKILDRSPSYRDTLAYYADYIKSDKIDCICIQCNNDEINTIPQLDGRCEGVLTIYTGKQCNNYGIIRSIRNREANKPHVLSKGESNWYNQRIRTMRHPSGLCRDCMLLRIYCHYDEATDSQIDKLLKQLKH